MNNIVLQKTWVQGRPVVVDNLLGTAFTGEAGAHTFKIRGVDAAQETVTISGTITGKLLAANNVTVSLSGSIEDGCAVVTLTDECYDVPGRFIFSVYATSGSTTLCLYCAVGNVLRTDSQVIAYPTESLPNITSLMADLEQILADWPADYSQLQSDVSSLKSASEALQLGKFDYPLIPNSYVINSGANAGNIASYNGWSRTDYIPVGKYQSLTTISSAWSEYNCFYNANKEFVSFFRVKTTETSVDVPDDAAYVIFSNTNAGMENLSVSFTTKTEKAIDDLNNELQDTNDAVDALSASIERQNSKLQFNIVPIHTPAGFTWANNPISGRVYTDYNGYYYTDFDVADYEPSGGVTYYVSPTGSSSNDGLTPDTPLNKMSTAYNKSDCGCIVLRGGVYNQGNNLTSTKITKNISIKAYKDEKPIITTHSGSTFSVYSESTYSANRGSIDLVMDMSAVDSYGIFKSYEKKTSIADVQANAGTYAHISGVLYIHCLSDREPDTNILLLIQADNLYAEGNPVVYLEGLTVIGGYSPVVVSNTQSNTNPKFYAKNCDFLYSFTTGNDAVMLQGTELSIIQNCRAMYALKDGFNYHAQYGTVPKAVEINCTGAFCGNTDDSNDQGSTIHDGGSAIRVNCIYFRNFGSNVADEAAESWNVGCVSYEPLAPNEGQRGCFFAITDTKMWLDSCTMFGKPHYPIMATNDGTVSVYLRNNRIESAGAEIIYGTTPIYY